VLLLIAEQKTDKAVCDFASHKVKNLEKWECLVCGYIYDPEVGDPEHGIPPKTSFEDLPEDWVCPVCNAPKNQFVKKQ
jgi:rubredoxin